MVWLARQSRVTSPRQTAADVPTDAALVAAAQADPRAFLALYERYADRIYGYCHARLGSKEAAEDAKAKLEAAGASVSVARSPAGGAGGRTGVFEHVHEARLAWGPAVRGSSTHVGCWRETGCVRMDPGRGRGGRTIILTPYSSG